MIHVFHREINDTCGSLNKILHTQGDDRTHSQSGHTRNADLGSTPHEAALWHLEIRSEQGQNGGRIQSTVQSPGLQPRPALHITCHWTSAGGISELCHPSHSIGTANTTAAVLVNWGSWNNLQADSPFLPDPILFSAARLIFLKQYDDYNFILQGEKKWLCSLYLVQVPSWTWSNITSPSYFLLTSFNMNEISLPDVLKEGPCPICFLDLP